MISRSTRVDWAPNAGGGGGTIHPQSQAFTATYSRNSRFAEEPGTNAEELLAAAHASCFTMALAGALKAAGHPPDSLETNATVHLDQDGPGFKVVRINLETAVSVPGVDEQEFHKIADDAKVNCPMSKALKSVEIFLDATMI